MAVGPCGTGVAVAAAGASVGVGVEVGSAACASGVLVGAAGAACVFWLPSAVGEAWSTDTVGRPTVGEAAPGAPGTAAVTRRRHRQHRADLRLYLGRREGRRGYTGRNIRPAGGWKVAGNQKQDGERAHPGNDSFHDELLKQD